jgi:5'-nucleotidase
MLKRIKEFFYGSEATIARYENGKLVELPRIKLGKVEAPSVEPVEPVSSEIQNIYDDWVANPDAWEFQPFTSTDAAFMHRGKEIRLYVNYFGYGPEEASNLGMYLMGVELPVKFTLHNKSDKKLVKDMFYSMKASKVLEARRKLADALDSLKSAKKRLLIDMDGVLMDYYGGFVAEWKKRYPERIVIATEMITTFYLEEMYPPEWKADILAITQGKDFFENMPHIAGAIEFMEEIWDSEEYDSFICTAPDMDSEGLMCATEKLRSIERLFGKKWLKRTIMTNDKTMIDGDILIDDKPEIKGAQEPRWKRVFFTHGYNKHLPGPRIGNWTEWREVLTKL